MNEKLKSVIIEGEFVAEFVDFLRFSHDKYEKGETESGKREWLIRELQIVYRMIREIHPEIDREGVLSPLNELILSLNRLDYGVVDPPLRPAKLAHRPVDPSWAQFRGYAAGAAELLIRGGKRSSTADAAVARLLSEQGYQKPGSRTVNTRITGATIKGWRKEARERRPGDLLRASFDLVVEGEIPGWGQESLRLLEPEIFTEGGVEKRVGKLGYSVLHQCLNVIDMILDEIPPPRPAKK